MRRRWRQTAGAVTRDRDRTVETRARARRRLAAWLLLVGSTALHGCAGAASRSVQPRPVLIESSARRQPAWIAQPPPSDHFFYATGSATAADSLELGKHAAVRAAAEEVLVFLGLRATSRYVERRSALVTAVLSEFESSTSGTVSDGRLVELYYRRYRNAEQGEACDRFDVHVLLGVPMASIEAERARLADERIRAVEEARALLDEAEPARLAANFSETLALWVSAYRRLREAEPTAAVLDRLGGLIHDTAARVTVTIEDVRPLVVESARGHRVRVRARLLQNSGGLALADLPLSLQLVSQDRPLHEMTVTTDGAGAAEVDLLLRSDSRTIDELRVRLHPSVVPIAREGVEAQLARPVESALARLREPSDVRMIHTARHPGPTGDDDPGGLATVHSGRVRFEVEQGTLTLPVLLRVRPSSEAHDVRLTLEDGVRITGIHGGSLELSEEDVRIDMGPPMNGRWRSVLFLLEARYLPIGHRTLAHVTIRPGDGATDPDRTAFGYELSVHGSSGSVLDEGEADSPADLHLEAWSALVMLGRAVRTKNAEATRRLGQFVELEEPGIREVAQASEDAELLDLLDVVRHGYERIVARTEGEPEKLRGLTLDWEVRAALRRLEQERRRHRAPD